MKLEQQQEIVGAENTNSPIRLRPQDYPGTHYGYFDTVDKTYKCETGDKLRYKGDYYGINLTNNIGLDFENYFENLIVFFEFQGKTASQLLEEVLENQLHDHTDQETAGQIRYQGSRREAYCQSLTRQG